MRRPLAAVLALLLCVLALAPAAGVLAQEASPVASPAAGGDVDLAAMTLDSTAMPAGYTLAAEYFHTVDALAQGYPFIPVAEFAALGITGYYESNYANADGSGDVRSYVIAYESEADVQTGFDLLEDESRTIPEGDGTWEDEPGLAGVGAAPSEVTMATYQIPDGPVVANVDATFRVDRFHLGVAASAYGEGAPVDLALVEDLAAKFAERVTAVLSGEEIPGIDTTLPALVPTLGPSDVREGYLTVTDAFRAGAPSVDADAFVSAYERGGSFSPDLSISPAPVLTVGVARFADADAALDALANADEFMPVETETVRADLDEVAGHPAAGFAYAGAFSPGQTDSFRIFVAVDDLLIVAAADGIASVDDAEDLARGFAEDAVACATDGTSCGPYAISPDLAVPAAPLEPEASPVA